MHLHKIFYALSLDELPQLFNVLKGKMSLIGPRPLIPKEEKVLGLRDQLGATMVLPEITGLAQVHGRDELDDEKKAEYDGKYAHHVSIKLVISCNLPKIKEGRRICAIW